MRARACFVGILALLAMLPMEAARAAEPAESSIVFIEVGYIENSTFVKVDEGSGFLVHPDGWVVTAKHLSEMPIPDGKIRHLRGAAKSRTATPNQLFQPALPVVTADIALLRFSPNLRSDWPFLKIRSNHPIKAREKIVAYGFPLGSGRDLEVRAGEISNLLGPNGSIGVNAGLAPGMSGGPVLLDGGRCVIGVVAGGSGYPNYDYFTPTQYAKTLLEAPPAQFVSEVADGTASGAAPAQAALVDKSFRIDETYDEHSEGKSSRPYSFDFSAGSGAKIVSARLVEESAAAVSDKNLNINAERTQATFKFRLESGPFYDRWRGWWHGQVILTLQRDAPTQPSAAAASCD